MPVPSLRSLVHRRTAWWAMVSAALLAGCAPTFHVPPAPSAADPGCARVVLGLPDVLGGQHRISTTSQGTAGWGGPAAAIVLRCGVPPLAPTTDQCVTMTDAAGTSVDWVVTVDGATKAADWTFVTYGRTPAVELTVPQKLAGDQPDALLLDVGRAVSVIPATHACE